MQTVLTMQTVKKLQDTLIGYKLYQKYCTERCICFIQLYIDILAEVQEQDHTANIPCPACLFVLFSSFPFSPLSSLIGSPGGLPGVCRAQKPCQLLRKASPYPEAITLPNHSHPLLTSHMSHNQYSLSVSSREREVVQADGCHEERSPVVSRGAPWWYQSIARRATGFIQ